MSVSTPVSKVSAVDLSLSPGEPDLKEPLADRCDNCITRGGDAHWNSSSTAGVLSPGWCKMGPERSVHGPSGQRDLWRTSGQNNNAQEKRKWIYYELEK